MATPRPVENTYIDSFDADMHIDYQGTKSLRETVRLKTGVVGSTHKFPKAGKGVATAHNAGSRVVPMNASRSRVTCTLTGWDSFEYEDIFDFNQSNVNDRKTYSENSAMAIGRREDQLIIDALSAGYDSGNEVGTGAAAMDVATLIAVSEILNTNNVPDMDRTAIIHPKQLKSLLGTTQVTSADYNSVKSLVNGDLDTFLGFKFIKIGSRDEGGIPEPVTNKRRAFFYHKKAVGLAIGRDMIPMVDWVADLTAWQIGHVFMAGAVVIDNEGVASAYTLDT